MERESGEHHVPGVRRDHDPAIVDAHLRALAAEAQALARASAALHDRVRAVEGELNALALSLRAGAEEPAPPVAEERPEALPPGSAPAAEEQREASPSAPVSASAGEQRGEDRDGARLVALNMALSGESREQTDRYLADSFQLADRAKLLDEVYAAIEG
jgi:hypothetical protein